METVWELALVILVPTAASTQRSFLGHPIGLVILFFTEMWERFSYYGMRALLIFYLTKHWLFGDAKANLIYGAYTSLVYITPMLGGYLADRYLGQRKAVQFGAVMLAIGHCLMTVEGIGGQLDQTINIFWLALSFIIVGSGFLKANINVIVGQLYPLMDPRRDAAYSIFYVGVNVGATLGSIAAGWLGETYGWRYGFGAAGLGMLLGLAVFVLGRPALQGRGEPPADAHLSCRVLGIPREIVIYIGALASVPVIWTLLQFQDVVGWFLLASGAILLGHMLWVATTQLARDARDRIFAIIFFCMCEPICWGLNEQGGGSLNLFTDRSIDRHIFGYDVPAPLFQSLNPGIIVIVGPILAWAWTWLGRRGLDPSTPIKFGVGVLQNGLCFLVLVAGARLAGLGNLTPLIWLFLFYTIQTVGELCLSPVGVSAMNRLAPRHMLSLIMGAWYFMTAAGEFFAGVIGSIASGNKAGAGKAQVLAVYETIGWLGVGIGIAIMATTPLVKRWMHLDTLCDIDDLTVFPSSLNKSLPSL